MTISRTLAVTALGLALTVPAYAQTAQQPQTPARPAAPATAPATPAAVPAKPAVAAPAAAAPTQAQKVNLNTAAATDLDKLPQIGEARAKTIVENRTKNGRFKNWDDFVARKVVPANAEAAIKDQVRF